MSLQKEKNIANAQEIGANILYPTTVFFASQLLGADPQTSAALAGGTYFFHSGYQMGRTIFDPYHGQSIEKAFQEDIPTPLRMDDSPSAIAAHGREKAAFISGGLSSMGRTGLMLKVASMSKSATSTLITGLMTVGPYVLGFATGGAMAASDKGEHEGRFSRRARRTAGGILAGSLLGLAYQNQDMFLSKTDKADHDAHKITVSAPVPPASKNAVAFTI